MSVTRAGTPEIYIHGKSHLFTLKLIFEKVFIQTRLQRATELKTLARSPPTAKADVSRIRIKSI